MLRRCLFFVLLFIGIVHFLLGEEIDQEERGKYQLFQDIKGFQSTVLRMPNDRYTLNISYGNEKTGELKFALSQQPEISIKSSGKYIDPFEDIQSKKNQKASAAAKEKDFYITPRIGTSTLTGLIGIELQYKHFAFDIGYFIADDRSRRGFFHILSYGIKYYFRPHRSTLYIGLGSGIGLDNDLDPQDIGMSFLVGYRWRWGKGWDFSVGLGAGISRRTDMGVTEGELALGYSF